MSESPKFRSHAIADRLIGFSISYQRENLLSRGLGLEHLRELLLRLARPLLRHSGSLAYGGHWREADDNFTFDLLRLVNAELLDNTAKPEAKKGRTNEPAPKIGQLFCHSAWPDYRQISKGVEAQWMNCCRILRINQARAGLKPEDRVSSEDAAILTPRLAFNTAVTLSAMRRIAMEGMYITAADLGRESVPPISARIVLGGRLSDFSGFAPGLFEEALLTLEARKPLYLLGGFGGAAEVLANAILETKLPPELTLRWQLEHTPKLKDLNDSAKKFALPAGCRPTKAILDDLARWIRKARKDPAAVLNTGLDKDRTRELLKTRSIDSAVYLVLAGFVRHNKLPNIAV
jgi:hypothetical protein